MTKYEFLGITEYRASVAYTAGGTYTVDFTRENEGTYSASVVLPSAINVINPTENTTYSKGDLLPLSWTLENGTTMNMRVEYTYQGGSGSVSRSLLQSQSPEVGTYNFDASTEDITQAGNVDGTVAFIREKSGTKASGVDGYIKAKFTKDFSVIFTD